MALPCGTPVLSSIHVRISVFDDSICKRQRMLALGKVRILLHTIQLVHESSDRMQHSILLRDCERK